MNVRVPRDKPSNLAPGLSLANGQNLPRPAQQGDLPGPPPALTLLPCHLHAQSLVAPPQVSKALIVCSLAPGPLLGIPARSGQHHSSSQRAQPRGPYGSQAWPGLPPLEGSSPARPPKTWLCIRLMRLWSVCLQRQEALRVEPKGGFSGS